MNYHLSKENLLNKTSDCLCLPLFLNKESADGTLCSQGEKVDEQLSHSISTLIKKFKISGETGKTTLLPLETDKTQRVLLLGLGEVDKLSITSFRNIRDFSCGQQ